MKYANEDVKKLGSILGIWAHPDDEAFVCAGLVTVAASNGQRVVLVTATKGGQGQSADELRWPTADLANIRAKELAESLKYIGKIEHHWLGYQDGALAESDESEAVNKLIKIIEKVRPDTVITFEPDGITGHNDHKTVYRWTRAAVNKSSVQSSMYCACENSECYESCGRNLDAEHNIYFNCECPRLVPQADADICFVLDRQTLSKKLSCIKAHASQTEPMFKNTNSAKLVSEMAKVECFIKDV